MQADAHGVQAMLASRVRAGAGAESMAAATIGIWQDVDVVLSPIIGQQGVAALYKRSLYLALTEHPCLVAAYRGELRPGDFSALDIALASQTSAEAEAAITALLNTFRDLLTHLIGGSLCERLLRTVWNKSASGDAVKDTSP